MKTDYNKQKNKSYPAYRDSGVEWLGKIPEHWRATRLKYRIELIESGKRDLVEYSDILSIGGEHIGTNYRLNLKNLKYVSEDFYNKNKKGRIQKRDILIVKDGATIGKTAYIDFQLKQKMLLNEHVYRVVAHKYIYYFILSSFFQSKIWSENNSSAQEGLNLSTIKNISILKPLSEEQKTIANFLDKETSCIDSLIQKKERQIELLKEKRLALITQAVTKGLNPNVKMKDSGIEWLGKIPEHWVVKKLKYITNPNPSNIDKKSKEGEKEVFLCNYVDVYKNEYIDSTLYFMKATATTDQLSKFILKKGDVIVTKDSEARNDIAVPALVIENFNNVVCGYHLTHIKPKKVFGNYLFRCFQSKWLQSYFEVSANGITRYGISVDKFNSAFILMPTEKEQKNISNFLDKETSQIDSLIEKIKKSINFLKEYRSALITSAVTGKIDVRKSQTKNENIVLFQKSKSLKTIEIKEPVFVAKANLNKRYSKSIQEKNPVLTARKVSQKTENSLFKKTVLGAKIVSQLKDNPHFGRTKFMKTLYLCEAHLQIPLKGAYKRSAAGPLDNTIYKMEGIMKKNNWFEPVQKGSMYKYKALKNSESYKPYFDKYWGNYREKLNQFLSFFEKFTTEQSEIIDTIYAVWNDYLIEGKTPSDNEIVDEVKNNWHKSKKRFSSEKLKKAIQWMRDQKLIPRGYGSKTNR